MDSITSAVENLHKLSERVGVIDMNAIELCLSYLIETCSALEDEIRAVNRSLQEANDAIYELRNPA